MPFFVLSTTVGKAAPRPCRRALSRHVGGGCMRHNGAHPLAPQPSAMPQTDSTAAASPLLRALYHRAHAAGPGLGAVALHLGAERTVVAAGPDAGEPAMVLTLALGHDKTRWTCSEACAAMLDIPDAWRFDPCILKAALTRQPAAAGFFTPDGTTTER